MVRDPAQLRREDERLLARLSPQAQSRPHRCEPQLRTILSDAIASKRRDHEVKLLGDARLWAVVDALALEQAVGHLIQNAVEASSAEAPITVRVARPATRSESPSPTMGPAWTVTSFATASSSPSHPPNPAASDRIVRSPLADRRDGRPPGRRQHPGVGSEFSIFLPVAEQAAQPQRKIA